jgi:formylglycine-generating enzyme required for sulfatase activity
MKPQDLSQEILEEALALKAQKNFTPEGILKLLKEHRFFLNCEILIKNFTASGGHSFVFYIKDKISKKKGVLKVAFPSYKNELRYEQKTLSAFKGQEYFIQIHKYYKNIPFSPFFSMDAVFLEPFCPSNLRDEFIKKPKNIQMFLKWILQTALALEEYHSKGSSYIHRDIKPENILIDPQENIRLCDFGIAANPELSHMDTQRGSYPYAPQEQRKGILTKYSDIYSLGIILYEIFHFYTLENERNERNLSPDFIPSKQNISKLLENAYESGLNRESYLPFQAFLERLLLSKNPQQRGTAEDFGNELHRLILKTRNHSPSSPLVLSFFSKSHPLEYIDMTSKEWCAFPVEKQMALATEYQKYYAQKFNHGQVKHIVEGIELVLIPPGKYWQGSPLEENPRMYDEKKRIVLIRQAFWCGKYPITQRQWKRIMKTDPSFFKGSEHPVESVSWDECKQFCEKTGLQLLSEAQWEYACRAGTTSKYSFGNHEEALKDYAWYEKNSKDTTHPLGQKKANAFGLYDMLGNVWEWCQDRYGEYQEMEEVIDPRGSTFGACRIYRGGSWLDEASRCRSAERRGILPEKTGFSDLGFRVCTPFLP